MEEKQKLSDITPGLIQLLKAKNYKEACIKKYIHTWKHLEAYMIKSGIACYCRGVGETHIKDRFGSVPYCDLKKSVKGKVRHIQVLSDYQEKGIITGKRLKVPVITFAGKLGAPFNGFIEYSKALKRNGSTIQRYKERINSLYQDLQHSGLDISGITAPYMVQYISRLDRIYREVARNNTLMTIRVFLRYLCSESLLENNREEYWMSILKSRSVRQPKIPSVYSREEVERLIAAIDRGNPQGKRDYAMVLLAARYGLRVSDIIGLRYCNLYWENNRIVLFQQKTGKKVELPLFEEIGGAIIEYLKFGRPDINEPYIFIAAHAPYGKLTSAGMHRTITDYMRQADIGYEERKHGPHALRHSLASNLLRSNEPMPVISEILGHSSTESTMCYLRVDFNQLKQCALEVPCVPSSFYENLYE
jgi:site-specific recombinase XerD